MLTCPVCTSGELELVERLADDRRIIRCTACAHQWTRGESKAQAPLPASSADLQARFPDRSAVDPARLEQVAALAAAAAPTERGFDWSHYQQVFSRDEVADCRPPRPPVVRQRDPRRHQRDHRVVQPGVEDDGRA